MNTMTLIKARSAIVHFLRTPGSHRKRTGASPYGLLAHTISHRVFRNSHRNFETPGSNLPDTVFRRGKKISGTLELDHIRLCFCFERWFAVTAVKEQAKSSRADLWSAWGGKRGRWQTFGLPLHLQPYLRKEGTRRKREPRFSEAGGCGSAKPDRHRAGNINRHVTQ